LAINHPKSIEQSRDDGISFGFWFERTDVRQTGFGLDEGEIDSNETIWGQPMDEWNN
jgi:hypothetical protein